MPPKSLLFKKSKVKAAINAATSPKASHQVSVDHRAVYAHTRKELEERKVEEEKRATVIPGASKDSRYSLATYAGMVKQGVHEVHQQKQVVSIFNTFTQEQRLMRYSHDLLQDGFEEGNWVAVDDGLKMFQEELEKVLADPFGTPVDQEAVRKLQEGTLDTLNALEKFQLGRAATESFQTDILTMLNFEVDHRLTDLEDMLERGREHISLLKTAMENFVAAIRPFKWGKVATCRAGHSMRHWGIDPEAEPEDRDAARMIANLNLTEDMDIEGYSYRALPKGFVPATSQCCSCNKEYGNQTFCWQCSECAPHVILFAGIPGTKEKCVSTTGFMEDGVITTQFRKPHPCANQEFILDAQAGQWCCKDRLDVAVIRSVQDPSQVLEVSVSDKIDKRRSGGGPKLKFGTFKQYSLSQAFFIKNSEERIRWVENEDLCLEVARDSSRALILNNHQPGEPRQRFCCDSTGPTQYTICQSCAAGLQQTWCSPIHRMLEEPCDGWQSVIRQLKARIKEVREQEEGPTEMGPLLPTEEAFKSDPRVQKTAQKKIANFFRKRRKPSKRLGTKKFESGTEEPEAKARSLRSSRSLPSKDSLDSNDRIPTPEPYDTATPIPKEVHREIERRKTTEIQAFSFSERPQKNAGEEKDRRAAAQPLVKGICEAGRQSILMDSQFWAEAETRAPSRSDQSRPSSRFSQIRTPSRMSRMVTPQPSLDPEISLSPEPRVLSLSPEPRKLMAPSTDSMYVEGNCHSTDHNPDSIEGGESQEWEEISTNLEAVRAAVKAVKKAIALQEQGAEESKWASALIVELQSLGLSESNASLHKMLSTEFGWTGEMFEAPNLNMVEGRGIDESETKKSHTPNLHALLKALNDFVNNLQETPGCGWRRIEDQTSMNRSELNKLRLRAFIGHPKLQGHLKAQTSLCATINRAEEPKLPIISKKAKGGKTQRGGVAWLNRGTGTPVSAAFIEEVVEKRSFEAEEDLSRAERVDRKYRSRASARMSTHDMHMQSLVSCVPSLWQNEEPDVLCQGFSDLFKEPTRTEEMPFSMPKLVRRSETAQYCAKGFRWVLHQAEGHRQKWKSLGSAASKKLRSLPLREFWQFPATTDGQPYLEHSVDTEQMDSMEAITAAMILEETR